VACEPEVQLEVHTRTGLGAGVRLSSDACFRGASELSGQSSCMMQAICSIPDELGGYLDGLATTGVDFGAHEHDHIDVL
jgi:hypothetical protein